MHDPNLPPLLAVVTGATDGIGRAYASQLATRKFNLLIISRSLEKLNKMRDEFESKFGIQVKVLAFDFTTADAKQYENVMAARLAEIDVGVLGSRVDQLSRVALQSTMSDSVMSTRKCCTRWKAGCRDSPISPSSTPCRRLSYVSRCVCI